MVEPMPRARRITAPLLVILSLHAAALAQGPVPPAAPQRPVTDIYHGQSVIDPYRWLENAADEEVQRWSDAQNAAARAFLDRLPARPAILARLEEVTRTIAPTYFALDYRAGTYFALMDEPPRQQPMLVCFRSPMDLADRRVIVDPNALDPTGETTIDFFEPSLDGRWVAVSLSRGGTESGSVSVYEVATGRALPDLVPGVNGGTAGGSVAWWPDGAGFLRTRYPQAGERAPEDLAFYEQVHDHRLGAPAESDPHVFGRDLPKIAEIFLGTTDDGRWVLADVLNGDGGEHAIWLRAPGGDFQQITRFEDGVVQAKFGPECLFLLQRGPTPNGRLLRVPLASPDLARAEVVVPEAEVAIEDFTVTQTLLYVVDIDGGPSRVRVFAQTGQPRGVVPLPDLVAAGPVVRTDGDRVLVHHEGYTTPPAWSLFDPATGRLDPTALVKRVPVDFAQIEVRREFATSKDGTRVPMSILVPKGTTPGQPAATILGGYGGYGVNQSPSFDERHIVWLEQGGILAFANLRGGGEYGEKWHQAGSLTRKQNVFDDFAACARHLVERGYTTPAKLAIQGGSNGGLLMGAELTQHPDLCGAVVSHVGVYDMLRVETTPNGRFNTTEYGTVQDPAQFAALYAYSPYHHVVDGTCYPSILFLTGANDPRVDPFHSRKMIARLQAATSCANPILLRTSATTGHVGTPYAEENERDADVDAFLFDRLGVEYRAVGAQR